MQHISQQIEVTSEMRECIQYCYDCSAICQETITHCLKMGGEHAEVSHIRTMMDCAEICQTSANYLLRGSDLHPRTCAVCAEACERCAQSCEQFPEDEMMQQCAQICRTTAESCREMAAHRV
jgi:hypothetical protein